MDGSRKSDAAATRKRRSSILKSQRNVRAPLTELEFNVATPDQAKSRRVSFSRRTGVAEFEIHEATTAWKNVYEEHNKSLESSANESGVKAAPRRVSHLGGRASHFEDEEVEDTEDPQPPPAQLEPHTNVNTTQFFPMDGNPSLREATADLDVDLSAMAPLALTDDLDLIQQDLEREPTQDNMDEISIDLDFNSTHFTLKADDDDMSITDSIRSSAVATDKSQLDFLVAATKKSLIDDWTVDKENIAINPYVAPPPAEFPCEDDILVFDGKKCKFQSNLDISDAKDVIPVLSENLESRQKTVYVEDMAETQIVPAQILQNENVNVKDQPTVVFCDGDISMTQAVGADIIEHKVEDKDQKTKYFNDLGDLSITQALPADIIQNELQNGHMSMTEAVPAGVLLTGNRQEIDLASKLEDTRRKTIIYGNEDVSITGVVPGNVCFEINRRRTIVYANDDGNVSMTGVVPTNIIDEVKTENPSTDTVQTIVNGNHDNNVSMTKDLQSSIIDEEKVKDQTNRRQTVVFGSDDNDLSMTGFAPVHILDSQQPNDRRKTIVYANEDNNISMTGVIISNILEAKAQQPSTERRKSIEFDRNDGNLSMIGVVTANILEAKDLQQNIDRRKTVVFGKDDNNLSITGVAPVNIIEANVDQQSNNDRRKTIVYENDDNNISMTGVVTANILEAEHQRRLVSNDINVFQVNVDLNVDRRRTKIYGNHDNNLSMTGVAPVNILEAKDQQQNIDRRRTVVFGNDDNNLSMTGVAPVNIIEAIYQQPNSDQRGTLVLENDDGKLTGIAPVDVAKVHDIEYRNTAVLDDYRNVTGVATANITDPAASEQTNIDQRRTAILGNDNNDLSMTGVAPVNIYDGAKVPVPKEVHRTIIYENDDNNVSITKVVPAKILDEANDTTDRRNIVYCADDGNLSTIKALPSNILNQQVNVQPINVEARKTVYNNELSSTVELVNKVDEIKQREPTNGYKRKSLDFEANGSLSVTGIESENINKEKTFNENPNKTIANENDRNSSGVVPANRTAEENVKSSAIDILLGNMLENDDDGIIASPNTDRSNLSMFGVVLSKIVEEKAQSPTKNVYEGDDVSMTGIPDEITAGIVCENTETCDKLAEKNDQDKQIEMIGDDDIDVFIQALSEPDLLRRSSTLNKDLVDLSNQVLVYETITKGKKTAAGELNARDNQAQEYDNASLVLSKDSDSVEQLDGTSQTATKESPVKQVVDTLLDMSMASSEEMAIIKSPIDRTKRPPSDSTITNDLSADSYIIVKDEDSEGQAQIKEPKVKKEHGIVHMVQRKLSGLKHIIHIKEKSPKKKMKAVKVDSRLPKSSLRQSTSPDKRKSVKIDLTSRMSTDYKDDNEDVKTKVDLISKVDKSEQQIKLESEANDTRAILDAISDFTDTRRSGGFEVTSPDENPAAPDRKSMIIPKEDLLREISMAQEIMKCEMLQTENDLDETEGSSYELETPPRHSVEVVKTLRFEDDDSILDSKLMQKPSFNQSKSSVIPAYEDSDPIKELMNDVIKRHGRRTLHNNKAQSSQANTLYSSEIDLIPNQPAILSPRSCLRQKNHQSPNSVCFSKPEPEVINFDHFNPLNNVLLPPIYKEEAHKYNPNQSDESLNPSLDSHCCQTDSEPSKCKDVEVGMVLIKSMVDRAVTHERKLKDSEVNTSIVMKGNRELLDASSSLTLVDDALPHTEEVEVAVRARSPVHVIFRVDDEASSVLLDSELTSDVSSRKKRGHVAGRGAEVTPKPALKVQKVSNSAKDARKAPSSSLSDNGSSLTSSGCSLVTAQYYNWARSQTSTSASDSRCSRVSDWRPDLLHELSSKNMISDQEPGVNVVSKIDTLPFMGTSECEWETRVADTWSFLLLRARLRLLVQLEHRATNATRALVRADTPVRLVLVQHATVNQERASALAALCLCLAAEALRRLAARGVARAGHVPALLRRCAAVVRVALRWGRVMSAARVALAFSMNDDGLLSLKVANIPLRSVWEVTLRIEMVDNGCSTPYPRATGLKVTRIVATWAPPQQELQRLLDSLPEDWGHVPRTIWKIFRYLKNKKPEDDLLAYTEGSALRKLQTF